MSAAPEISVVVPMYRSAETLRELHERLCRVLEGAGRSFEIWLVNDACPAGSEAVAAELADDDARTHVLSHERNGGQHRAVLSGLARTRGDWVILLDADLQDPPEAIPQLLAAGDNVSAVFAGRRGRYESQSRLLTSRIFKTALHLLCGVPRDAGMFVALHRTMVDRLLAMHGPEPFVVAMIGCSGLPVRSIPVERATRPRGESAYTFAMRLRYAYRGLYYALRWRTRTLFG